MADEGAGDGDATPHAAGEAGGKERDGFLKADKAERLVDAAVDFFIGNAFLDELVGDIIADGEGVEECAFLKDHAGTGAEGKELLLWHAGDFLAEEMDGAMVGAEEAVDEFEEDAFSDAGGAEQDAGFGGGDGEGDVVKDGRAVKGDRDVAQVDDRRRGGFRIRGFGRGCGGVVHQLNMASRSWVMRKSTKMMSTEAVTTA